MTHKRLDPLKILFLDIDGVLNTARAHIAFGNSRWDPTGIAILDRVCRETGAKIVISSVWRGSMERWMHAHQLLDAVGLGKHGICSSHVGIDFKDDDESKEYWRTPKGWDNPRGRKIQDWLDEFKPDNYAILDDDCDMLSTQAKHFVKCNGHDGVSYGQYDRLINILGKKDAEQDGRNPDQMELRLEIPDDVPSHKEAKMGGVYKGTFSCEFTGIEAFCDDHAEDIMREMIMDKFLSDGWAVRPHVTKMTEEELEESVIPRVFGDEREAKKE